MRSLYFSCFLNVLLGLVANRAETEFAAILSSLLFLISSCFLKQSWLCPRCSSVQKTP